MKTRLSHIISLFAIGFCFAANAQFSLSGRVYDAQGTPLPDVKIQLEETYLGATSDKDGFYTFSSIPSQSFAVKFIKSGFETQTQITRVDRDVQLDVYMKSSAIMIEEVQVVAVRANDKTPTTFTNLTSKQIQARNFGRDLPYLLESTPSTVVTSDAGGGVGYTGIRLRGVDPTRTNVTVNGIPLNDSESHGVYWVNMPDFASSTDNIQVQRGVGTSTNGAASFGASINIKTDNIQKVAYAELDNSIGSFSTLRNTVKVGTGLINNKFTVDARLSRITSD